eukprot:gene7429-8692_t
MTEHFEPSLHPGAYHELDALASDSIDFYSHFEPGVHLNASRYLTKRLTGMAALSLNPFFGKGTISGALTKHTHASVSCTGDQDVELDFLTTLPFDGTTSNVSVNTNLKTITDMPVITGTLARTAMRYHSEIKYTNQSEGLVGLSHLQTITRHFALGGEAYFKPGQNNGGAGVGGRYNGKLASMPFQITSTYNLMGDLSLSFFTALIPSFLNIATRYTLNTSSMNSQFEAGTSFGVNFRVGDRFVPITLRMRTSSNLIHAATVDVVLPVCILSFGTVLEHSKKPAYVLTLYSTDQSQYDRTLLSVANTLISQSLRVKGTLRAPVYTLDTDNTPCELYSNAFNYPSFQSLLSESLKILKSDSTPYLYDQISGCFVYDDAVDCAYSFPTSGGFKSCSSSSYYSPTPSTDLITIQTLIKSTGLLQSSMANYLFNRVVFVQAMDAKISTGSSIFPNNYWTESIKSLKSFVANSNTILSNPKLSDLSRIIDTMSTTPLPFDPSSLSTIITNTKTIIDSIITNMDTIYSTLDTSAQSSTTDFFSVQSAFENYMYLATSSVIANMIGNEILMLNSYALYGRQDIGSNDQQVGLLVKIKGHLSSVALTINNVHSLAMPSGIGTTAVKQNAFVCHYLAATRMSTALAPFSTTQQLIATNNQQPLSIYDLAMCRDLYERRQKITLEMTINSNLTVIPTAFDTTIIWDIGHPSASLYTSLIFGYPKQSTSNEPFSQDTWSMGIKNTNILLPTGGSAPPLMQQSPARPPRNMLRASVPCTNCDSSSNCCANGVCNLVGAGYYRSDYGACTTCDNGPAKGIKYVFDATRYTDSNCAYVCTNSGYIKSGDPNNFIGGPPCIVSPIGTYSPGSVLKAPQCTLPSRYTPPDLYGFISNGPSTDTCQVGTKYQAIFVNNQQPTTTLRRVDPYSVLSPGHAIELWLAIETLPTPLDPALPWSQTASAPTHFFGLTGVDGAFEFGVEYNTTHFRLALYNPSASSVFNTMPTFIPIQQSYIHLAVSVYFNGMMTFFVNGVAYLGGLFQTQSFPSALAIQYLGGPLSRRAMVRIDELRFHATALTPSMLGTIYSDINVLNQCIPKKSQYLCSSGACLMCNLEAGFVANPTTCACQCPPQTELVSGRCLDLCPSGSLRAADSRCICADGLFSTFSNAASVTIASQVLYSSPLNYNSTVNNLLKVGLTSVTFLDSRGLPILPLSCQASSTDSATCEALYDSSHQSIWTSAINTGFGWVTFTLPPSSSIAKIIIAPAPAYIAMTTIRLIFSSDATITSGPMLIANKYPLSPTASAVFTTSQSVSPTLWTCVSCPTSSVYPDQQPPVAYTRPPHSIIPRTYIDQCTCDDGFAFYTPRFGCMTFLPSPVVSNSSGTYGTGTPITVTSAFISYPNIIEAPYSIRHTLDGSDPIPTSPILDLTQPLVWTYPETVVFKVRAFQDGRLPSAIVTNTYVFKGVIICVADPPSGLRSNSSFAINIKCSTAPQLHNEPTSYIYYTTDSTQPSTFSNKYNAVNGIKLTPDPNIGVQVINVWVLSRISEDIYGPQSCRMIAYTNKLDPPIIVYKPEVYVDSWVAIEIFPNVTRYIHTPKYYFEVNNGVANLMTSFELKAYYINLTLSPQVNVETFQISIIDCHEDYICSDPSSATIKVYRNCRTPTTTPLPGDYIYNVTILATCGDGCTPRYEMGDKRPGPDSSIFPDSLKLTTMIAMEESVYDISIACFSQILGQSLFLDARYSIQSNNRPIKPTYSPAMPILLMSSIVSITCRVFKPAQETCTIYFNIKTDLGRPHPVPNQSLGDRGYAYKYGSPFPMELTGSYNLEAISVITPATTYDQDYSSVSKMTYQVYGPPPHVQMVRDGNKVILFANVTGSTIFYLVMSQEMSKTSPVRPVDYKQYLSEIEIVGSCYLYAFDLKNMSTNLDTNETKDGGKDIQVNQATSLG